MKWQACSQGLTYDAGDGFIVYFAVESGRTHLLSEVAAWLLAELAVNPLSTEQLQERVVDRVESVSEAEVEKLVEALLLELQSFDLVESA